ncbi:hypothetical protein H6G80_03845 [Nostoc sp. FACHB-87]|uniref:DUF6671 family protein n=1 Tax=Nostocales TaxID=1161 RepID=UPI0016870F53|nr:MULTISPECIES: DUF6671 family protein [Nostocales]MBD2453208.1 hypothetical protein [Nostoc sp. FACHB-87]MBD2475013.1 hypothetical protein [Anabaena sp. FACHB-83]MBD2491415.1 hypothetical protein [Aulosira sp. FACHB-615]
MQIQQLFSNRVGIIATMHHKEKVIAPLLEQELNLKTIVPSNFNTDDFGTFTREIKRPGTQIAAAKLKAETALKLTGETIAISSEGSFVPHPMVPYIYSNREVVLLLDKENELEIIGEEFSIETNFNHQIVASLQEAEHFAKKIGFPEHGLVVSWEDKANNCREIVKGIITAAKLQETITIALNNSVNSQVNLETDMRALYNPTRMNNIEKATLNLLTKIKSLCPQCSAPGFAITEKIAGLPCEMCSMPTSLTLSVIYQCQKCGFKQEKLFPHGQEFADPAQCMYCNP